MSNHLKAILFSVVVSLTCGSLLTLASTGLKDYHLRNMMIDRQKNVLKSVGLYPDRRPLAPEQIEHVYAESIKPMWIDSRGELVEPHQRREGDLPVYLYLEQGRIQRYAIPVDCRGLWGKIQGYLALNKDGATVAGFTVYNHSETPGLGGEIATDWFQKNFEGQKIIDDQGNFVSISIAKGKIQDRVPAALRDNAVDGISGATLTGKFLSAGLKETLGRYEIISKTFRKKQESGK